MNKKKLTYIQGNVEYEIKGYLGSWAVSSEKNIKNGDVRYIAGELLYAYMIEEKSFGNLIHWASPDKTKDYPYIRMWVQRIAIGEI